MIATAVWKVCALFLLAGAVGSLAAREVRLSGGLCRALPCVRSDGSRLRGGVARVALPGESVVGSSSVRRHVDRIQIYAVIYLSRLRSTVCRRL